MKLNKVTNQRNSDMLLKAVFDSEKTKECKLLLKKQNQVTEFFSENTAKAYLGSEEKYTYETLVKFVKQFVSSQARPYQVDVASFAKKAVKPRHVVKAFVDAYNYANADLYSAKTNQKNSDEEKALSLLFVSNNPGEVSELELTYRKQTVLSEAVNFARNLQILPPNIANSEYLAKKVENELSEYANLEVKVLDKEQIEDLNMGLLLSVNRGSMYEPRVVVIEYKGNKESEEKTVMVGKGITFDSGGYSLKPARSMLGMKFDMSGAAIVASAMMAVAEFKPRVNLSAVLCLTDNRVNGDASLPDSVWESMSGKTVEVNNTDAEGRLVMADGLTYAVRKLNATRLIDVATLTGAILSALGTTYTGVWATSDQDWQSVLMASKVQDELVWRMPLDDEFSKEIKKSLVADLKNTDLTGMGGSNSAAMFLKEFTENRKYVHFDIAGTAEQGGNPTGVMVKTLVQLAINESIREMKK